METRRPDAVVALRLLPRPGKGVACTLRPLLRDNPAAAQVVALRLSPLSDDAWVNWLNRGSTLIALGQPERALPDLQRSVELSKAAVASGANQAEPTLASRTQSRRNLEQSRAISGDLG